MNSTCRFFLFLLVLGAMFAGCERHDIEETGVLHQKGGHHGEGDHGHEGEKHGGGDKHHQGEKHGDAAPSQSSSDTKAESRDIGI